MPYFQSNEDKSVVELVGHPGPGYTKLTKAEGQRLQREQACDALRKILKPGDSVYCILRHCSRSGMRRHISLLTDGMRDITWEAAHAMGEKRANDGGIRVDGCGMDMGFHLVYNLGRVLWPEGFGVHSREGACATSRAEAHILADAGNTFRGRNSDTSGWDNDGGYALKHRWI